MNGQEQSATFECFGSSCSVFVTGAGPLGSAREAVAHVRSTLLGWHERFSRFEPASELSRLNGDPRPQVPTSPLMARLADAAVIAGSLTGGLVDATLIDQVEALGYTGAQGQALPLPSALRMAPPRARAAGGPGGWRQLQVDLPRTIITRPPGVKLDSGGLAKGLFADVLAEQLAGYASFAVNCAGDLIIGGAASLARPIHVESPFDGVTLHTFALERTGVATSGIGRRAWLDARGRPAHHLIDPSTGLPAFTGIVQATALAPSGLVAEIHAKAAILSGPGAARAWLPYGGVIVFDDGSHDVVEPPPVVTLSRTSVDARPSPTMGVQHA
jgi:thiamine biosynthesis lipoprotein